MGNSPSRTTNGLGLQQRGLGRSVGSGGGKGRNRKDKQEVCKEVQKVVPERIVVQTSLDFNGPRPPMPSPLIPDANAVYDLCGDGEDICPTCLEEYSESNPKIATTCGHPFHLSCILEWADRNPHCPLCGVEMEFIEGGNLS